MSSWSTASDEDAGSGSRSGELQVYGAMSGEAESTDEAADTARSDRVTPRRADRRDVFRLPAARAYLAQSVSPASPRGPAIGNDSDQATLGRTPQEHMDSQPGFTVAGMPIMPTLGLGLGHDDNITLASRDEISSWFYRISPAVRAEIPSDHSVLTLVAALEMVRYEDSPIDDYDAWYLRGLWTWDISLRQRLDLFAQYAEGADRRGRGRRQGDASLIPLEPDEWEQTDFGGTWTYGALGARGRLTLDAGISDLEYTNNRDGVVPGDDGTRALDRDWFYYGGTFFWRVAPKTSLLLDYLYTDINYETASNNDSEVEHLMLGATWEATARTTGRIQYGIQDREFADPTREDYSGPAWIASLSWRLRSYSMFRLTGARRTEEPDGNGDYSLREDLTLSWLHDWATRFGTTVDVGAGRDRFEPDVREDDLFFWGVGARYAFNQHLRFGASVTYYDRDSDIGEFSYDRTVYLLTLEASL